MRATITIDDELASGITTAAKEEGITKEKWMIAACRKALESGENSESSPAKIPEEHDKLQNSLKEKDNEIISLKKEINHQTELKETYSKFLEEKTQRIDDLKEEIARIESMSMTMTDQILLDRDERIKDLNHMIEHLQAQAAAHSVALQSAIRPALEGKKEMEEIRDLEEDENKPKKRRWFFRK
ncbi:hypothetical protein [Methanoplanus endosymbiosus]|uniref:Uncharacterized protein n=1 Tax=Methanoplanus endosymbiosus TaxID=33865 RepID=A0A9E7PNY4_9EURY|nr:hypothetical protein [Methanoplanus endosymbiosus]UUX93768.1 hypothetical protein L6E24_06555 [Methanoplanus endosymbiosus]